MLNFHYFLNFMLKVLFNFMLNFAIGVFGCFQLNFHKSLKKKPEKTIQFKGITEGESKRFSNQVTCSTHSYSKN